MTTANPYEPPQATLDTQSTIDIFDESSPFSASGRFGRASYIAYAFGTYLAMVIVVAIVAGIVSVLGIGEMLLNAALGIGYLVFMVFAFIFMIRRLHDLNWSGWLSLLSFVPLVNLAIAIPCLFFRGTNGPNKYGPPRKTPKSHTYIATAMIVLTVGAGILGAIAIPVYQEYVKRASEMSPNTQQLPQ